MTKHCSKCKEIKDKSEFSRNKCKKDGMQNVCKVCESVYRTKNREVIREYQKEYRKKNRELIRIEGKKYYQKNLEAIKERKRKYYGKNREAIKTESKKYYEKKREAVQEAQKIYKQKNPEKINMYSAKRRAIKRNACPDWLTQEHHSAIAELYSEAQKLTEETGIPHHVDHIVPLKGKSYDLGTKRMRHTISGLHVPWNLQVVSEEENLSKGCRYSEWK